MAHLDRFSKDNLFTRHLNYYKKDHFYAFFSPCIRISKKFIIFNNKKINKNIFHRNKTLFTINDIDVYKISLSKGESYSRKGSYKYFTGYNDSGYSDHFI